LFLFSFSVGKVVVDIGGCLKWMALSVGAALWSSPKSISLMQATAGSSCPAWPKIFLSSDSSRINDLKHSGDTQISTTPALVFFQTSLNSEPISQLFVF
jgi:hypothetical protein